MKRDDDKRTAISHAQILNNANSKQPESVSGNSIGSAFGKYAALLTRPHKDQGERCGQSQTNKESVSGLTKVENVQREPKSCAQVRTFVKQQAVQQKSDGLPPDSGRATFIGVRLSSQERQLVLGRAINSGLKLSAYARAALLGADYVAKHDPVRRKLLQDLSRELGHQGNNLNQIAKQLNSGFVTQDDAYALLNNLGGSLVAAHNAVRLALTEGKVKP